MNRLFVPVVICSLACAAAGQPADPAPNGLKAPSDSVAAAFDRQLTMWGFTTSQQRSGEATIVRGSIRLPRGRKLAGHGFGYWADCGKELALSRAAKADEMRIDIVSEVHPQPGRKDGNSVQSSGKAWASFTAFDRQALGDPEVSCSSRGVLEQALLNAGHAQSKGQPYVEIQPDGPYALSPRPGDSLSLPLPEDPGVGNPPSLEACTWDSLYQPYLSAKGEVTYTLTSQGIPDTASLAITSLQGIDAATFQNAGRRLIANCRFRTPAVAGAAAAGFVRQQIFFGAADALDYRHPKDSLISSGSPRDSTLAGQIVQATMIFCPSGKGLPPGRVEVQLVIGLDG